MLMFLMTFTGVVGSAQQWSPPGAHWQYTYDSGTGIQGYVELFYTEDTLINNEPARKLFKVIHAHNFITDNPVCYLLGSEYTYEDNGVVFIWSIDRWDTLYNFNANVGESWGMARSATVPGVCDSNSTLSVIAKGNVNINSVVLRYLVVEFHFGGSSLPLFTDTLVERVGFTGSYFFPYDRCYAALGSHEGGVFRCYTDHTFAEYKPTFSEPCNTIGIGEVSQQLRPTIMPNPVQDALSLRGVSGIARADFRITDLSGRIVKAGVLESITDVSALPPGIYLLTIRQPERSTTLRFVKR
jgi:hypothetical protein